jgi:hypothetical protein
MTEHARTTSPTTHTAGDPNPVRNSIRAQLSKLAPTDHNGRTITPEQQQPAEPVTPVLFVEPAQQPAMQPNPAQGATGTTGHATVTGTPTGGSTLDRIRAQATKLSIHNLPAGTTPTGN